MLFRHASSCLSLISPRYKTVRCAVPPVPSRRFSTTLKERWTLPSFLRLVLRRNIYAHNAKIYRARKEGRSSPQRRSHLVVLTLRNLSPNRSQKRPIYHLNCESQAKAESKAGSLLRRRPSTELCVTDWTKPLNEFKSSATATL